MVPWKEVAIQASELSRLRRSTRILRFVLGWEDLFSRTGGFQDVFDFGVR